MPRRKQRRSSIFAAPRRTAARRRKSCIPQEVSSKESDDSSSESEDMDVELGPELFHEEHEFMYYLPPDAGTDNIADLEECLIAAPPRKKRKMDEGQANSLREAYEEVSNSIKKHVYDIVYKEHARVYQQVATFCKRSWSKGGEVRELKDAAFGRAQVPTACVLLGGSSAHESLLYDQLTDALSEISPLVARVEVDHSGKNLKLNNVLSQIVSSVFESAIQHCTQRQSVSNKGRKQTKRTSPEELRELAISQAHIPSRWDRRPMSVLSSWYNKDFPEKDKPMVLVLEGLNLWPSSVVQKLFLEMQNLVKEDVPVVVVTGMTSLQALIDKLDFKTKRLIFAQDFRLAPANTLLDKIIEEVLYADWWPFHMSTDIVKTLLTNFKTNFYSTAKFIESLNLLVTSYFVNEPLAKLSSILLPEDSRSSKEDILEDLNKKDLRLIGELNSVKSLPTARKKAIKQVDLWSEQWKNKKQQHKQSFDILWKFCSSKVLPHVEKMELYFDLREHAAEDSIVLMKFWKRIQSKADVHNQCRNVLQEWEKAILGNKDYKAYAAKSNELKGENLRLVQERKSRMSGLHRQMTPVQTKRISRLDMLKNPPIRSPIQKKKKSRLARNQFKSQILNKDADSRKLLQKIRDMINDFITEFLPPVHSLPLHEVFSLRDIKTLREALQSQPSYIFSEIENAPFENDMKSMFEFWQETDRFINVAEWLKRFIDDQDPNFITRDPSREEKQNMSSRFRRALNDFKTLGLIDDNCIRKGHVKQCDLQHFILQKLFKEDNDDRLHQREATVG